MFALFFSLYTAMFVGSYTNYAWSDIFASNGIVFGILKRVFDGLGTFATSIFGDGNYTTLGTDVIPNGYIIFAIAFVLALITSIGIVVMAVKGIKRVFGVFFMGVR